MIRGDLPGPDGDGHQDADLRRGVSAAYYALFHDVTDRAARHLIGSSPDEERNRNFVVRGRRRQDRVSSNDRRRSGQGARR